METRIPSRDKQSLIAQNKEDIDINRSVWKVFTVISVTILTAFVAGYLISIGQFWYGFFATVLFFVIFTLQTFLIKSWVQIFKSIFLESCAFIGPFFFLVSWDYLLTAWLGLFIFLLLSFRGSRQELHSSLKIHFWRTARASLSYSIIGVLFAISLMYISLFINNGVFIGQKTFVQILQSSDFVMAKLIPGFSFNKTLDETLHATITANSRIGNQILEFVNTNNKSSIDIMLLPDDQKEKIISQMVPEISKNIQSSMGNSFNPDVSIADNIYNSFVVSSIEKLSPEQRAYIGLSTILLIIITVKSMAVVLYIPLIFIAFILYELFIAAGFMVLRVEPCSREILILK
ncbi:MAG: hypothetical protein V1652_03155 [bacterium]